MSFSIISALTVLLTLGQAFNGNGQFVREFKLDQKAEVMQALQSSCQMLMEDENMKLMNVPMVVQVMKNGLERYEKKRKEAVEAYCERVRSEAVAASQENPSAAGATEEVPVCDEGEALTAFETEHAAEFESMSKQLELFQGFDLKDAIQLYGAICSPPFSENLPDVVRLDELIKSYNRLAAEALDTDLSQFNNFKLPQSSFVYAADGETVVGEIFGEEGRRTWVPLNKMPPLLKQAFISAEDQRFREHRGIDRNGILRGFVKYMQSSPDNKRIEGGSTITQQVLKNTVAGTEVSLDRKVREMILAVRLEDQLKNKDKILEIYLNLIFLGRNSWGVQMAAQNYFGPKQKVADLNLGQIAFLAGITHTPNSYEPGRPTKNIRERQSYVLGRLRDDGFITQEQMDEALKAELKFIERRPVKTSYFQHAVTAEVKKRVKPQAQESGAVYHSTQSPVLQAVTEASLQEQLARYEMRNNLVEWNGPLRNLAPKIPVQPQAVEIPGLTSAPTPLVPLEPQTSSLAFSMAEEEWSSRLKVIQAQYQDIHWKVAIVLKNNRDEGIRIGVNTDEGPVTAKMAIADVGNEWAGGVRSKIREGDVVFVTPYKERFALRVPPVVQGSAVVLEAHSGKVLALAGGFSVHFTEYNRALNSMRQPGSTVKPFTFLAALQQGLQPDTIVPNSPIYFDKVERRCNAWRPKNYDDNGPEYMSLRRGLETSSNRVAASLLKGMNPEDPVSALNLVRDISSDFGLYENPYDCFPFILGSDETSLLKLTAAYAAIANGGKYIEPHFLDEVKSAAQIQRPLLTRKIKTVDAISLFQLKHLMTGVVLDGTARELKDLNGEKGELLVAGKTGTSSGYNDAWFVGFSDKIVVGIWMGYDERRALKGTGGTLAPVIAKDIFAKAFETYSPKDLLKAPPKGTEFIELDGQLESIRASAEDTRHWLLYGYSPLNPPRDGAVLSPYQDYADEPEYEEPQTREPEFEEPEVEVPPKRTPRKAPKQADPIEDSPWKTEYDQETEEESGNDSEEDDIPPRFRMFGG